MNSPSASALFSECALQRVRSSASALFNECALQRVRSSASALFSECALQQVRSYNYWSLLMPNHQLSCAKYHFCDSFNERLMFRSDNKNCGQNPLCKSEPQKGQLSRFYFQKEMWQPSVTIGLKECLKIVKIPMTFGSN